MAEQSLPLDAALDAVRIQTDHVWSALSQISTDRECYRVLFVGADDEVGTTTIAAATAIGLARHTLVEVGLVEANIARPSLATYLGRPNAPGLTELVDGGATLEECIHRTSAVDHLSFTPAGRRNKVHPGDLSSESVRTVLAHYSRTSRFLLIDAPPVLEHADTSLLLRDVDGVVLVIRAGATKKVAAKEALKLIEQSGTPVLGSVLNAYTAPSLFARRY